MNVVLSGCFTVDLEGLFRNIVWCARLLLASLIPAVVCHMTFTTFAIIAWHTQPRYCEPSDGETLLEPPPLFFLVSSGGW